MIVVYLFVISVFLGFISTVLFAFLVVVKDIFKSINEYKILKNEK